MCYNKIVAGIDVLQSFGTPAANICSSANDGVALPHRLCESKDSLGLLLCLGQLRFTRRPVTTTAWAAINQLQPPPQL